MIFWTPVQLRIALKSTKHAAVINDALMAVLPAIGPEVKRELMQVVSQFCAARAAFGDCRHRRDDCTGIALFGLNYPIRSPRGLAIPAAIDIALRWVRWRCWAAGFSLAENSGVLASMIRRHHRYYRTVLHTVLIFLIVSLSWAWRRSAIASCWRC